VTIQTFRNISSENPIKEVWKLLRFFRDVEYASKYHCYFCNISEAAYKKHKSNINKQAIQIGYCIRQAEEYFQASSQVGLATRPNLLYYGAVSLSQALILLKQDGTHSLDARRKQKKHNHHGLELAGSVTDLKSTAGVEDFFNSLGCTCFIKQGTRNNVPWGHFPLFYESLVPSTTQIKSTVYDFGELRGLEYSFPIPCADLLPIENFVNNQFNLLEILKTLPDIYFYLSQTGVQPGLCQGTLYSNIVKYYKNNEKEQIEKYEKNYTFALDSISKNQKDQLLRFYDKCNTLIKVEHDFGSNILLVLKGEFCIDDEEDLGYFPDIVENINGKKFYILNPENYLPEPASHLIVLFCLGMLCRYYPDVWMKVIDENVQVAELTDSLLNIIYRKFPNLILDQMTGIQHYVHL
jgi:hypothetical protein